MAVFANNQMGIVLAVMKCNTGFKITILSNGGAILLQYELHRFFIDPLNELVGHFKTQQSFSDRKTKKIIPGMEFS